MLNSIKALIFLYFFGQEIQFMVKFGLKNKNCWFQVKFATKPNSNMLNLMVMFEFSILDRKYPFRQILIQKKQDCLFNIKVRS